jgi:hypothetical protein
VATADTARLIALLELQDKFSKPLGNAERKLGGFERKMDTFGRGASTALGNIAKVGVVGAVAAVGVLTVAVKKGVDSINELENVTVATNTVLESTNAISGQTAEGIRQLSEKYEDLNATMDDKVIQSGANMLLTFTNVREEAFEPALEAALNLNEAMGGGPDSLQGNVIKVGKALQDPTKGLTALSKAGVVFSADQKERIKQLQEEGRLYEAQQLILEELTTQFGGRFAAAGDTAEGKMAKLADRIEDVQMALAGPLIPVIDRVRDKLIEFLGSPTVLEGAERLGEAIAGLFTDERLERGVGILEGAIDTLSRGDFSGLTGDIGGVVSAVAGLPWESIGNAATLLGTGAKAMLDAFMSLPPWVQTAVLTGWGLNKLTGGALGSLVGELGKGLVKGVLGMNAGVVNINAATVTGGPGGIPTPGGKTGGGVGGLLLNTAKWILGPAAAAALGAEIGNTLIEPTIAPARESEERKFTAVLESGDARDIRDGLKVIDDQLDVVGSGLTNELPSQIALALDIGGVRTTLERQRTELRQQLIANNQAEGNRFSQTVSSLNATTDATRNLGPRIDRVGNNPHNVNVDNNITVPVYVSATLLQYKLTSLRTTTNSGGFI